MEDPPIHTAHRGALSRIFTPKNMSMLEPKVRDFCARSLDPLIDSGQLDFVADHGAKMPMRVIGMLLGIPDEDLESVRQSADAKIRTERGQRSEEHTSELQSLMRTSYAVFCLKKNNY